MSRTVTVKMADGTEMDVDNVPDSLSDAALRVKIHREAGMFGKPELQPGDYTRDVWDSIKSAPGKAAGAVATVLPKAVLGLMHYGNSMAGNEDAPGLINAAKAVQGADNGIAKTLGGTYDPATQPGQVADAMTQGGIVGAIPGGGLGLAARVGLGAASGAAGLAGEKLGGPAGGSLGAMAPNAAVAGLLALRPTGGLRTASTALGRMQPDETSTMLKGHQLSGDLGVPNPMPWQTAPDGSALKVLGMARGGGMPGVQENLGQQRGNIEPADLVMEAAHQGRGPAGTAAALQLAQQLAETQKLRNQDLAKSSHSVEATGPVEAIRAGLGGKVWAALPIARGIATGTQNKDLDAFLSSDSYRKMEQLAERRPKLESAEELIRAMVQAQAQGYVQQPGQPGGQ